MPRPVLYLVDACPYVFRAYYSLPGLRAPDGREVLAKIKADELLRRMVADGSLFHHRSAPVTLRPDNYDWVEERTERSLEWIKASGIDVVGLDQAIPATLDTRVVRPGEEEVGWDHPPTFRVEDRRHIVTGDQCHGQRVPGDRRAVRRPLHARAARRRFRRGSPGRG